MKHLAPECRTDEGRTLRCSLLTGIWFRTHGREENKIMINICDVAQAGRAADESGVARTRAAGRGAVDEAQRASSATRATSQGDGAQRSSRESDQAARGPSTLGATLPVTPSACRSADFSAQTRVDDAATSLSPCLDVLSVPQARRSPALVLASSCP